MGTGAVTVAFAAGSVSVSTVAGAVLLLDVPAGEHDMNPLRLKQSRAASKDVRRFIFSIHFREPSGPSIAEVRNRENRIGSIISVIVRPLGEAH